jgi:hypothetical protein
MESGDIYRHDRFYCNPATGEIRAKYLILLAPTRSGDWVARLLTSRQNMRPRDPPCFHGDPYPGYFLGVPGPPLTLETWVDLRKMNDVDSTDARSLLHQGILRQIGRLSGAQLSEVIKCAAGALDTTLGQERALRVQLAMLR